MPWKRMLAYITGSVNEDLLRRIEYLLEENRVLRNQIDKRILLTDKAIALGKLPHPPLSPHSFAYALRPVPHPRAPETEAVGGVLWSQTSFLAPRGLFLPYG
jgi:hypothetical protein